MTNELEVMLFPDTGPGHTRSLRTLALYADRIHTLTFLDPEGAAKILARFQAKAEFGPGVKRVVNYCAYLADVRPQLELLENEGILKPYYSGNSKDLVEFDSDTLLPDSSVSNLVQTLVEYNKAGSKDPLWDRVFSSAISYPPASVDYLMLAMYLTDASQRSFAYAALYDNNMLRGTALLMYYLLVAILAEKRGAALSTWSTESQSAVWASRQLISNCDVGTTLALKRGASQSQLGQLVVEQYLPPVDEMPLEDVLWLRTKRASELSAFRSGMAELATHVDVTQSFEMQQLQIRDLISAKVNPAVRDLEAAISASKLDIIKKSLSSKASLSSGSLSAALSYSLGGPLDVVTATGVIGALGAAFVDSVIEQKKLRNASQWSFLLNLKNPF